MYYSVDRIENGIAVLIDNDENTREVPLTQLPQGVGQSDVLWEENGAFRVDMDEKQRRQQRIRALERRLGRR